MHTSNRKCAPHFDPSIVNLLNMNKHLAIKMSEKELSNYESNESTA